MVILIGTLASGEHKFPDYPIRPANDYAIRTEKHGLVIGVEPVEDVSAQRTYFNTDLTAKGFLPVFVVISNQSTQDSYIFQRTNVEYGAASKYSGDDVAAETDQTAVAANVTTTPAVYLVPGKIVGASNVSENIVKKQIQSGTVSPGASVHGFLYIPVPKKSSRDKLHLQVPLTKAGTNETHVLNVFF